MPARRILPGGKGYDTDPIRRRVEAAELAPDIPPKVNRCWKPGVSPVLNGGGNAFCRLEDFRRIAKQYDRLDARDLAAVCRVATVTDWF